MVTVWYHCGIKVLSHSFRIRGVVCHSSRLRSEIPWDKSLTTYVSVDTTLECGYNLHIYIYIHIMFQQNFPTVYIWSMLRNYSDFNYYNIVQPPYNMCHNTFSAFCLFVTGTIVSCSADPGTPTNGQRSLSSTTFRSIVRYTCDDGYTLQGLDSRTCQSNGQWNGSAPQCNREHTIG